MPQHEKCKFDNAIHLVLQWKFAHPIVNKYLTTLQQLVSKLKAMYCSSRDGNTNHCVKELLLLVPQPLCVGAVVMLLNNFIVELNIMNGSVRTIKDILYETRDGMDKDNASPAYIIFEFTNSKLPVPLILGKPNKWIPIPFVTERCEWKC